MKLRPTPESIKSLIQMLHAWGHDRQAFENTVRLLRSKGEGNVTSLEIYATLIQDQKAMEQMMREGNRKR